MKYINVQKPKWSLKTNFWGAVAVALIVSFVTFIGLKKSIWVELEIIVGLLSFSSYLYLFYLLFHGIRFEENEKYTITWKPVDFSSIADGGSFICTDGSFTSAGGEGGCIGLIIGFLLDIIVSFLLSILIALLLWIGINVVITSILVIFLPAFYLFKRSIRFVVAKGRRCYKNISKSAMYALEATIVGSLWLYGIVFLGHYLSILGTELFH